MNSGIVSTIKQALAKLIAWLSDLKVAIVLLLAIAVSSGLGTAIPQGEPNNFYLEHYNIKPWLGLVNGSQLLKLELDHLYTSNWFLFLLAWLAIALLLCSLRRQWPALRVGLRWLDYQQPRQLSKLAVATSVNNPAGDGALIKLKSHLEKKGWAVKPANHRLAARRGLIGRVGPLLVHGGLIVFMVGAVVGAFGGQRLERYLAPGRSLELLNRQGETQLELALNTFTIDRDPAGRPEQFSSSLELRDLNNNTPLATKVSVNHPIRHRGITIYQADWSLAAATLQLGNSPLLQLPLQTFPELGDQVWGLVIPTKPDGSDPILIALQTETGPAQVFAAGSELIGLLPVGGGAVDIDGLPIRLVEVLPASGLLIKRDPGVPLVYTGFAILLLGGGLSIVATRQLWAIVDGDTLHIGGLCNRNLTAFADELPEIAKAAVGHGAP
jgi:cytochrome c biogenesis protein